MSGTPRVCGLILGLALLFACGKPSSSCPTVDEVLRGSASEQTRREYEIIVNTCRADGWSAEVTKCLRDAKDDESQERCFRSLSAAQQKRLQGAFKPVYDDMDEESAEEMRDHDRSFQDKLAALHLDEIAARAPACAGYRDAIHAIRKSLLSCPRHGLLGMYGIHKLVELRLTELGSIQDDHELATLCGRHTETLRTSSEMKCIWE